MRDSNSNSIGRRTFLGQSLSCGAYIAGLAAIAPWHIKRAFASSRPQDVVAEENWGRIEKIADGVWSVISTPFDGGEFLTVCNGGIIQGDDSVMVVESFMNPEGAQWVGEWAENLTGSWPSEVVVSHYHGDHTAGASGLSQDGNPIKIWATEETDRRVTESRRENPADQPSLENVSTLDAEQETHIDLGGRQVTVTPRLGHTSSDVTIAISDPHVVWCGDLFFNKMVPNYMDSQPAQLTRQVESIGGDEETLYIPGHGAAASRDELNVYVDFLKTMQREVKSAFDRGISAEEAAEDFSMPDAFEEWYVFSPQVIPRMVAAWYRDFADE